VDHFKRINDTEGHAAGDIVLRDLAAKLRATAVDAGALPIRWGGEEFVVLAAGLDLREAAALGETIRAAISDEPLTPSSDPGKLVTVSVGCSSGPLYHLEAVVETADTALYAAKRAGRNRVIAAATPA
jgi:two-component system cell cycle response regulator